MKKTTLLSMFCVFLMAIFAFTVINVDSASAYPNMGNNCASCHDGSKAPKLGGSDSAPAKEPAKSGSSTKSSSSKTTISKTTSKATSSQSKTSAPAASTITIKLNNQDTKGYLVKNTTLAPVRKTAALANVYAQWDNASKTITLKTKSATIILTSGKDVAKVNDQEVKLNAAVKIVNGVAYAPVRFLADNLGLNVVFDGKVVNVY